MTQSHPMNMLSHSLSNFIDLFSGYTTYLVHRDLSFFILHSDKIYYH
jgi:hypothetical protein